MSTSRARADDAHDGEPRANGATSARARGVRSSQGRAADVRQEPWVELRSAAYHPFIYRRMVRHASPKALPGDLVAVYDKEGARFGSGFYNPRSQIAVRMLRFGTEDVDARFFESLLERSVSLRRSVLGLDNNDTDTYRVVHAEGDSLSGLVVDRFADILSVEVFSLGVHRHIDSWLPVLHRLCGTKRELVRADTRAKRQEGFDAHARMSEPSFRSVQVRENGVRFAIDFERGQKTGFFCDQRDNRKRLGELVAGKRVLDVCSYTGGFSLYALTRGKATECTGIDLDEKAIDQARHNANLNQVRARWVHADAFTYMRQMAQNARTWDAVVLDPPKLIPTRRDYDEGKKKYFDLNRLALSLVEPGGLFLTCSCSGLMGGEDFEKLVSSAGRRVGRGLQILEIGGASPDHPVSPICPESRYLKAIWARIV